MTAESSETDAEEMRELVTLLAYAGCVWWSIVALGWMYWATGGTAGVWTLWGGSRELSGVREPWIETVLWTTGGLALVSATLALILARQWTQYVSLRMVNAVAWLIGVTLVPYVAIDTVLRGLVVLGVLDPANVDRTTVAWRLLFWNPWWIVGVVLFCAAAWLYQYTIDRSTTETDASA